MRLDIDDGVAIVTIDNPPVNALLPEVCDAIRRSVLDAGARSPEVRCIVLTGAGRCFAGGADIRYLTEIDESSAEPYVLRVQEMQAQLGLLPQPVIAALHGAVLGGGLELALACDVRIADEGARFGLPEVTLGLIPGAGGTQNLPRLIGPSAAKRLLFTGERIDAAYALALGVVDDVVPAGEAVTAAVDLGRRIAANAPLAVAAAKRAVNLGMTMSVTDAHRLEATLFSRLAGSADWQEGTTAFIEKRAPRYHGR